MDSKLAPRPLIKHKNKVAMKQDCRRCLRRVQQTVVLELIIFNIYYLLMMQKESENSMLENFIACTKLGSVASKGN